MRPIFSIRARGSHRRGTGCRGRVLPPINRISERELKSGIRVCIGDGSRMRFEPPAMQTFGKPVLRYYLSIVRILRATIHRRMFSTIKPKIGGSAVSACPTARKAARKTFHCRSVAKCDRRLSKRITFCCFADEIRWPGDSSHPYRVSISRTMDGLTHPPSVYLRNHLLCCMTRTAL
jgi:hypothetical protein